MFKNRQNTTYEKGIRLGPKAGGLKSVGKGPREWIRGLECSAGHLSRRIPPKSGPSSQKVGALCFFF